MISAHDPTWKRGPFRHFARSDHGSATVEFVIAVPFILMFLFSAIDFGVVMLRQVFLDRSVDMAMREVRLGNVAQNGLEDFRTRICDGTFLIQDCTNALTIEMRPVDTTTWAGLDQPAQCVNREEEINPVLTFNPGAANQIMMVNVCAVADPFISLTGIVMGMVSNPAGEYLIATKAAFVNEPGA